MVDVITVWPSGRWSTGNNRCGGAFLRASLANGSRDQMGFVKASTLAESPLEMTDKDL